MGFVMPLSCSKTIIASALFAACCGVAAAAPANVTTRIKLREGPGTHYAPVATIPPGDTVDVLTCEGAWCEINWRGMGGFASRSYLAYGYRGRTRHPSVPLVVMPPPSPPPGPVVYSVPYYDPPIIYRGGSAGVAFGF